MTTASKLLTNAEAAARIGVKPNTLERWRSLTVADMRAVIRRGAWRGREHYFATVYAGIQPPEQQKQEHMRDWISFCLYQLADPAHNKDEVARVDALIVLSELHGLTTPKPEPVTLPHNLLELIENELARRQAQR